MNGIIGKLHTFLNEALLYGIQMGQKLILKKKWIFLVSKWNIPSSWTNTRVSYKLKCMPSEDILDWEVQKKGHSNTIWQLNHYSISNENKVIVCWFPGQEEILGNKQADELARKETSMILKESEVFSKMEADAWEAMLSEREDKERERLKGLRRSKHLLWSYNRKGRCVSYQSSDCCCLESEM